MSKSTSKIVYRLLQAAVLIGVVGFWFHTSNESASIAGKYSSQYFKAALGVTAAGLIGGWLFLRFLFAEQRVKLRRGAWVVPLWFKLAATAAVVVAIAVPAEIILRGIRARVGQRQAGGFHPYLQAVPKPDEQAGVNRWGFRGESIEQEKPKGTYRIFVLGGSTVFCSRVGFEQTHCRVLEKILRAAYPDEKIEVQNAGMHWHTSQHSLIKLQTQIEDFDPDMIIVYHAINDLCRSFSPPHYARPGFRADYGHYDGPIARIVQSYRGDEPLVNSVVLQTIGNFIGRYWFSDFHAENVDVPSQPVHEWKSLDPFRRNMKNLAMAVLGGGRTLVIASQPSLYKEKMTDDELSQLTMTDTMCRDIDFRPDVTSMREGMNSFNAVSRRVASEMDVPFVDLDAAVPKTTEHFIDDVHYTAAGNRVIGETMAKAIVELGVINVERGPSGP